MRSPRALCTLLMLCSLLLSAGQGFSAPAKVTPSEDLTPLALAEYKEIVAAAKGKVVIINFFASWCPPCREEIPGLIALRKSIAEDKLVLIGVSVDEQIKDLQNYAKTAKFNYPVRLAQPDLVRWSGVSSIPHMIIYDKEGKVVANEAGLVTEKELRDFLKKYLEK